MKTFLATTAICALLTMPVFAQAAKPEAEEPVTPPTAAEVDSAVKEINALVADDKKVAGYCAIQKELAAVPETDEKKAEEVGTKMDTYLASLGEPVTEAFGVAEVVDPASEDGKKIDTAFGALEAKCGS
ncbi:MULTISPECIES: hypothetical protein [Rhodomicrobium]|uniref:hypothetical protein n=1 Tax=Rhodomicrobium TaxID=1068 RepID=UPI000F73AB50|nr:MULTISPECIES: hypothetical protein [Rhodomicrobium]